MLNHTLQPLEVSAWPDDWRGGCSALLELDDCKDIPNVGDIKEYVPYIRRLREAQNPWNQEGGVAGGARSGGHRLLKGATGPGENQSRPPRGGQAVPAPLGDEEAPRGATDVWGDLEEALQR